MFRSRSTSDGQGRRADDGGWCGALGAAAFYVLSLTLVAANLLVWIDPCHPPNFRGWLHMGYCIAAATSCWLMPWLLFGHRSRWLYRILIPAVFFIDFALVFVRVNFNYQFDGSWVGMLMSSDPRELKIFFFGNPFSVIAAFGGIPVVAWLAGRLVGGLRPPCFGRLTRIALWAGSVALVLAMVLTHYPWERNCALYFVVDTVRSFGMHRRLVSLKTSPTLPDPPYAMRGDAVAPVGVLVIGESATRSHLGIYGYPRDTTPCLAALRDELVVFTNVMAVSTTTSEALTYMFTTATLDDPSDLRHTLAQALVQAGCRVGLLSNQRHWGIYEGTTQYVFAGCTFQRYLADETHGAAFDMELLEPARAAMADAAGPTLLILHLQGSHSPFAYSYPLDEAHFPVSRDISDIDRVLNLDLGLKRNHYDNSIRYTDRLLGGLVDALRALRRPAFLVYVSDHGETPDILRWRVVSEPSTWEVPMVVWMSGEYRRENAVVAAEIDCSADVTMRLDRLFPVVLRLMGVEN